MINFILEVQYSKCKIVSLDLQTNSSCIKLENVECLEAEILVADSAKILYEVLL